jgi:hypothetical protein
MRTTTKKDGTPPKAESIDAYEQQTAEFLSVCKAMFPKEITGQHLRSDGVTTMGQKLNFRGTLVRASIERSPVQFQNRFFVERT